MKPKEKHIPHRAYRPIPVLNADVQEGLSPQDVKLRLTNGLSNKQPPTNTKSSVRLSGRTFSPSSISFFWCSRQRSWRSVHSKI